MNPTSQQRRRSHLCKAAAALLLTAAIGCFENQSDLLSGLVQTGARLLLAETPNPGPKNRVPVAAREPREFSFSVAGNGLPTLYVEGVPVVRTVYAFWGPDWKWHEASATYRFASEGSGELDLRVEGLGLRITADVTRPNAQSARWQMLIERKLPLGQAIGGGLEFQFDLESPALPPGTVPPTLLPDARGWSWAIGGGSPITVSFEPAAANTYFEGSASNAIRTFLVGPGMAPGRSELSFELSLPKGARYVSSKDARFAAAATPHWVRSPLDVGESPIDLSGLNHLPAGRHGFVRARGDALVFEDGTVAIG